MEYLSFPLEWDGIVIILHEVYIASFTCVIFTSSHKLCALIIAIAPSDLWNLSCNTLVLILVFFFSLLWSSCLFFLFPEANTNVFDCSEDNGSFILGPSFIPSSM